MSRYNPSPAQEARDEAKWERFFALTGRQKIFACLFNLTIFPVMSPAAKLQAMMLAVLTTALVLGGGTLVQKFFSPAPKPVPRMITL